MAKITMEDDYTIATLLTAPVEWQGKVEAMTTEQQRASIDTLDVLIERATRLRGYIDKRYGWGCGDQGHTDGVKEGNKLVRKVRKATGFTIAERDLSF